VALWSVSTTLQNGFIRITNTRSAPLVQSSQSATGVFICMSFVVALFNYIRFAREVIWQICDYTGIACFTVRKKDKEGHWVDAKPGELKKLQ
jgi:hypothetical protein